MPSFSQVLFWSLVLPPEARPKKTAQMSFGSMMHCSIKMSDVIQCSNKQHQN
jgi:hypothetical protein